MSKLAYFRFLERLNEFLARTDVDQERPFRFSGKPSLKDAIESIGVPHVEVGAILVNGKQKHLNDLLSPNDHAEVFPVSHGDLREKVPAFIADSHLGKLAKDLRMLGMDTLYQATCNEKEIVRISLEEGRIALTRSLRVLKYAVLKEGYWVRSEEPLAQVREVMERYQLMQYAKPFSRCLNCNGELERIAKAEVLDLIPPLTEKYFNEFYQCSSCRRVYWKGSHYERMLQFLLHLGPH